MFPTYYCARHAQRTSAACAVCQLHPLQSALHAAAAAPSCSGSLACSQHPHAALLAPQCPCAALLALNTGVQLYLLSIPTCSETLLLNAHVQRLCSFCSGVVCSCPCSQYPSVAKSAWPPLAKQFKSDFPLRHTHACLHMHAICKCVHGIQVHTHVTSEMHAFTGHVHT